MNAYRVSFYKKLTNSYGMPFNVCQRSIEIHRARTPERAVAAAKFRFERRESVSKWFLYADYVEVDALEVSAPAVTGPEVAEVRRPVRPSRPGLARRAPSGRPKK